mgnify:FL=1
MKTVPGVAMYGLGLAAVTRVAQYIIAREPELPAASA